MYMHVHTTFLVHHFAWFCAVCPACPLSAHPFGLVAAIPQSQPSPQSWISAVSAVVYRLDLTPPICSCAHSVLDAGRFFSRSVLVFIHDVFVSLFARLLDVPVRVCLRLSVCPCCACLSRRPPRKASTGLSPSCAPRQPLLPPSLSSYRQRIWRPFKGKAGMYHQPAVRRRRVLLYFVGMDVLIHAVALAWSAVSYK